MGGLLIGELAARAGTTTRALRYYEEQGLLASDRTPAGYRTYEAGAVLRVRNIRELLACGFTVEDVKSFLSYLDAELPDVFGYHPRCARAYGVGAQRVAELEERIATLSRLRDGLVRRMPWLDGAPGRPAEQAPAPEAVVIEGAPASPPGGPPSTAVGRRGQAG